MSDRAPWTYHVCLGTDDTCVMEVGPFTSATEALTFSLAAMGREARKVDADVTDWLIDEGPDAAPVADWREDILEYGDARLIGYTIERYDGEETDGNWSLNGGLRRSIREAAAA